jgi:hypothetical protein
MLRPPHLRIHITGVLQLCTYQGGAAHASGEVHVRTARAPSSCSCCTAPGRTRTAPPQGRPSSLQYKQQYNTSQGGELLLHLVKPSVPPLPPPREGPYISRNVQAYLKSLCHEVNFQLECHVMIHTLFGFQPLHGGLRTICREYTIVAQHPYVIY